MAVIFNCAMRWGIVERGTNPLSLVRVKGISRRQAEPRIQAANEIQALIAALPMDPYRTMVIMALSTGLRCSELFALKWIDFDWEQLTILVRRAIVDGVVGDVKTKYSTIRLTVGSGSSRDPLHLEAHFPVRRRNGLGVCQPADGQRTSASSHCSTGEPHKTRGDKRRSWRQSGMAYLSAHLQLSAPAAWRRSKVQQDLLRHAVRTTMNVYTQAVSEQKRAAHSRVVQMVLG